MKDKRYTIHLLTPSDVPLLEAMSTMFGEAFEERDTYTGARPGAAYLERLIADPVTVNPKAEMPAFADRLSREEIAAIASYLAGRK